MSDRRVVITGLGPVTPIGAGTADFWNALLAGANGIRRLQAFAPDRFDSQMGGEIEVLKVADHVPKSYRKAAKIMARDIVLAVVAAHYAVTDAGLKTKCVLDRAEAEGEPNLESTRFGANIGAGLICADLHELAEALHGAAEGGQFDMARWGREGMQNLTPLWLLKFLPNMLACHVTIVHDAQGPSNTITCGEASSHLAIGEAFRTIARGTADVCICGGAESKVNPMALMRQGLGRRLSTLNDTPEKACRPFAAGRDGTVVAEGGGLVILEELEHARRRGARVYAELVGFGACNEAYDPAQPSRPSPEGRGTALAISKALRDARADTAQVDLVGSPACGLVERDAAEAAALKTTFGDRVADLPVLNVKGGLGNSGAGSGAIDFIATVLAAYNATIPPAINSQTIDPACGLRLVTGDPVDARVELALSLAYALGGGQHAALVIKRFRDESA
ncbi:MAG: beta-ketoacyl-[acyl-carrier-protein] synthase family protein [Planctomycetes bacterium]|nr:beta-ketoacyl-[acyl-carrier-protein] synthase family protein [Planctomycetota bacterium]